MTLPVRSFGVSVVIPTYNRPQALRHAIESVRTRHPELVEIVVVDDGSNVDPREQLPEVNTSAVPVRCYRFELNRGPQAARNLGIRRARFAFIAFLDSDDEFMPEKIDELLDILARGGTDLLFHGVLGMEKYNRLSRLWSMHAGRALPFRWLLSLYNPAPTPALVVRRERRLGLPGMRHCEDYAYLLRYCQADTRVEYLDRNLTLVNRAPGATGGLSAARRAMRRGEFRARLVLLRHPKPADLVRFALGGFVGAIRIANDLVRGRYLTR